MVKKLSLISLVLFVFGILSVGPSIADGEIAQSLLIGVKQDSGSGFTNADLNGAYWFRTLSFQNFETDRPQANISYGMVNFDGRGFWTGTATGFDSDGSTGSDTINGTYRVNDDGSYSFVITGIPPEPDQTLNGQIPSDNDMSFGVLSQGEVIFGTPIQGIVTVVRAPDNPFVMADPNGSWQFRDLELRDVEEDFREASACSGTLGINSPNWNANFNCLESDGTTDVGSISGTYTLSENTFNFFATGSPAVIFSAYLSTDGNILIFTRGDASDGEIEMFMGVALRESTKVFSNADLSGSYVFNDMFLEDVETDDREASVTMGQVTFDGNGNWTGSAQSFDSDGSSGADSISGTYSVYSDGSFTLVTSETPSSTLTGTISDDTDTIILSERESTANGDSDEAGFDYLAYLSANPDLPQTWGNTACMNHYITYGFFAKRAVAFNIDEYLKANPDLPDNWTFEQGLSHYNAFGKNENRLLAFDGQEYLSLYADLPQNWTDDQAYQHYLYFGQYEGRIASFDEIAYLEMYLDLPRTWTQAESFFHYLNYGQYEGRAYDPYDESVFGAAD